MSPARSQCSNGNEPAMAAAFRCSGYGCAKPEYAKVGCCAPSAVMEYIGEGYIPGIDPWESDVNPG